MNLAAEPRNEVAVTLRSEDTDVATTNPTILRFNSGNWDSEQTVTVSALHDDDARDAESIRIALRAVSVRDADYNGLSDTVKVEVTDDETAGIVLSKSAVAFHESKSTTYTVKLSARPAANVTVSLANSDTSAVTVSPSSLTFTNGDWDTEKTVTLTGVWDADTENESAEITHTAQGATGADEFDGKMATVAVTVMDDNQRLTFSPPALRVAENKATASSP